MQFTPLQLLYLGRKADRASIMLTPEEVKEQKDVLLALCDNCSPETPDAVAVQSAKEWFTKLHNYPVVRGTGAGLGYTEEEAVGNAVQQFKEDFGIRD